MNAAIRIAVVLMMTVIGLGLTVEEFRRLLDRPRLSLLGTIGQWLLLPLAAAAVAWALPLPPHLVAGMILVVGSPAGAISNYYSYLGGADVALSVSLTAAVSVGSVLTMPIIVGLGFKWLLGAGTGQVAPYGAMLFQLLLVVVAPVAVGMVLRFRFPGWAGRHQRDFRRVSQLILALVVALVVFSLRQYLLADLWLTVLSTVLFSILAGVSGLAVGKVAGADRRQLLTLVIEFACRNTAITILIGVAVLDRPDFAVFGLVFFLTQIPLMLGTVAVAGRWLGESPDQA